MKFLLFVYLFLLIMSLALFFLMGSDKTRARKQKRRIPERRLFLFAIFGGAIGGTIGMYLFHHKTLHWYFALFFPLLAVLQAAGCIWLSISFLA